MAEWAAKRFWKLAEPQLLEGGWQVLLDGRQVKPPAKASLVLPTLSMAEAVAEEWQAQEEFIDPNTMPVTRSANAGIDKVAHQFDEVVGLIAEYGSSDLLCYRADGPTELVQRQAEAWDPLLDWAATNLKAPMQVTSGIMPIPQPAQAIETMAARLQQMSAFEITAISDLVALSGSLVIGLAVVENFLPADELWNRSRIDEMFQIEQWGEDEDGANVTEIKRRDFMHADRFFRLAR